jgi:hypothetical protein
MTTKDFTVGHTVFVGPQVRQEGYTATIEKIGKKWVSISRSSPGRISGRFDPERMRLDQDFGSAPSIWLSEEQYRAAAGRDSAWLNFRLDVSRMYSVPNHLNLEQIQRIVAIVVGEQNGKTHHEANE